MLNEPEPAPIHPTHVGSPWGGPRRGASRSEAALSLAVFPPPRGTSHPATCSAKRTPAQQRAFEIAVVSEGGCWYFTPSWDCQPSGAVSNSKERLSPSPRPEMNPRGRRPEERPEHTAPGRWIEIAYQPLAGGKRRGRVSEQNHFKDRRRIQNQTPDLVYKATRYLQKEFYRNKKCANERQQATCPISIHPCTHPFRPSLIQCFARSCNAES